MLIYSSQYIKNCFDIIKKINKKDFDCICCLKRSGFILGSILSNQLSLQLFTNQEIENIPDKYKRVLLVDDKICTGKSFQKNKNLLYKYNKDVITLSLYIQANIYTDIFLMDYKEKVKLFYEVKNV